MRRFIPLLLLAVVPAARADAPVGAAYVPAAAALVVQVRLADLWKSDSLKDFRRVATRFEKTSRNFLGMVLLPPARSY